VAGWASVNMPQDGKPVWEVVAAALRGKKHIAPARRDRVLLKGVSGNPGYQPA
jgi:S-sulfosulfanyl-L-cysteine sulfohydrolase